MKISISVIDIVGMTAILSCIGGAGWLGYQTFMEWYYVRDLRSLITVTFVGGFGMAMSYVIYSNFRGEKKGMRG
jgi:hypothetical protein